jgi:hypothetical protein
MPRRKLHKTRQKADSAATERAVKTVISYKSKSNGVEFWNSKN